MPTPSIQTLRADAQQVLNLDSISAVRSVVAATLANANAGTPLNPNLTTQQLWNEFYQIVTQPKSDIESIIANQLMKFMYAPPAPGGAGADKQVIFNDGGVLAGDPQFLWNKTTNLLTVTGSATITGDLTVDTSTLKVDSTNNRVGIGTASPADTLNVVGNTILDTSAASFPNRLVIRNTNTGGYGARQAFSVYDYFNSAQFETVVLESTFAGFSAGGSLSFRGKKLSSSSEIALLEIKGSGDIAVSNGNLVMATSGKGIDFSATANSGGTMTSELLNDYEEGTFTPTIIGTSTAGTGTYSTQSGTYTKVGRLVSCQIFLNWTAHTGTGDMRISGLPFQVSGASNYFAAATIGYLSNISLSAGNIANGFAFTATSVINLGQYPTGGGAGTAIAMDTSGEILISVTYIV